MDLALSDEQELLRDTFADLFATESSPERIRAAESTGFDPALWKTLADAEVLGLRVAEAHGGSGAGLFDAVIVAEQAGRHLASVPLLECFVTTQLLARADAPIADDLLRRALAGDAVVTLALRSVPTNESQLVPGGAVADAVVGLDGDDLVMVTRGDEPVSALDSSAARSNFSETPRLTGGANASSSVGVARAGRSSSTPSSFRVATLHASCTSSSFASTLTGSAGAACSASPAAAWPSSSTP